MKNTPRFGRICALWGIIVTASALLLNCGGSSSSSMSGGGDSCNFQSGGDCTLQVNGVTRTYVLHVPSNFQPGASALIIALHGGRGNGQQMESATHLSQKADQVGFAVAYPDGLAAPGGATTWNGYFAGFGANPPDDSGFLRQLILTLESNLRVNPKMVYVTGISAGGYMTYRAGIDLSDLVAAIGVVEGSLDDQQLGGTQVPPSPQNPVSLIMLHGDQDQVIHYCGTTTTNVVVTSEDQTFDFWWQAAANSCSSPSPSGPICTAFGGTPTSLFFKDATGCRGGAEVRFYRLFNGTHNWYSAQLTPGNPVYNPDFNSSTGTTTNDILWNFFVSHAKP